MVLYTKNHRCQRAHNTLQVLLCMTGQCGAMHLPLLSTLVRGQHRTSQQVTTGVGSLLNKHLYLCEGYFHSTSRPPPVGGGGGGGAKRKRKKKLEEEERRQ